MVECECECECDCLDTTIDTPAPPRMGNAPFDRLLASSAASNSRLSRSDSVDSIILKVHFMQELDSKSLDITRGVRSLLPLPARWIRRETEVASAIKAAGSGEGKEAIVLRESDISEAMPEEIDL